MKKYILCFGEVLWDNFADGKQAGGAPMNVAAHLVQQGHDVSVVSRVGNDAPGRELITYLKKNDLYGHYIQVDEELPTCQVSVQFDEDSQPAYTIPQPVAWDNIKTGNGLKKYARKAQAIVYGSLACRDEQTAGTLHKLLESPALKVFDVNLREPHYTLRTIEILAAKANIIKMNEDEARLLTGSKNKPLESIILEFQKKYHNKIICVTRGAAGAMLWYDEEFYQHPGFEVKVEDTVGAGDAFLATLVSGILNDKPIDETLEKACLIGAYVSSRRGANPKYDKDALKAIKNTVAA